ncbi:UU173 family protein [Mycoplasma buteonis]|uniref:UU173 family protein n=1 Tax=Mycoplasma buteonis TaxID=171280 RepID=UPI000690326D|nr:DUF2779 domain-containing protein [Mycoplasma buteonis]
MNKEILVTWTNFKRIFDKNPILIFEKKANFKEKLSKLFNDISFKKIQSIDIEELKEEDIENSDNSEIDIEEYENGAQNLEEQYFENIFDFDNFKKITHEFEWFDFDDKSSNELSQNDKYMIIKGNSFNQYKLQAIENYIEKNNLKSSQIKYVSVRNSNDDKAKITENLIKQQDVDLIVNPVFIFEYKYKEVTFKFVLTALLYDKRENKLVDLSFKSFSSLQDNYKCLFSYLVLKNIGLNSVPFDNYSVLIVDPLLKITKNFKKHKIEFFESYASNYRLEPAASKISEDEFSKKIFKVLEDSGAILNLLDSNKELKNSKFSFFNSVKYNNQVTFKLDKNLVFEKNNLNENLNTEKLITNFKEWNKIELKNPQFNDFYTTFNDLIEILYKSWLDFGSKEELDLQSLKYFFFANGNYLTNIPNGDKKSKTLKEPVVDKLFHNWKTNWNMNYSYENTVKEQLAKTSFLANDNKYFGGIFLPAWIKKDVELKYILINTLIGEEFERLSGKYYQLREIYGLDFINHKNNLFNKTQDFFNFNIANLIKKLHVKDARICWYDYEGFSDIFPIFNHINPYNQVVNQVSIIVTQNGKELSCSNIVKDTKNLKLQDLCDMIFEIYSDCADAFVVFNKSYENTRNIEILNLIKMNLSEYEENKNKQIEIDKDTNEFISYFFEKFKTFENFKNMIYHINSNTVDLADSFMIGNLSKNEKYISFNTANIETYSAFTVENNKIVKENLDSNFIVRNVATFGRMMISIKYLKYFYSIKKIEKYITHYNIDLKNKIIPYTSLKEVQKGTDAMEKAIQRYLGSIGDNLWENQIVPNLKRYCENDVRAMLMVYDFVMEILKSSYPEIANFEYNLESENNNYQLKEGKLVVS